MKRLILAGLVAALPLAGCAEMSPTQQRALSGTAIGAGGGAVIGAIAGNARTRCRNRSGRGSRRHLR
jgi:hypothetical protein